MMIHGICKMNGADLDGNKVFPKDLRKTVKLKKLYAPLLHHPNYLQLQMLRQAQNLEKENIVHSPLMRLNLLEDFCLKATLASE